MHLGEWSSGGVSQCVVRRQVGDEVVEVLQSGLGQGR